jgi:hypothetical protein
MIYLFEKVITTFTKTVQKSIFVTRLTFSSNFLLTIGFICTTNYFFYHLLDTKLEYLLEKNYENKKEIKEIKSEFKNIHLSNNNKKEILLSLLEMQDDLFINMNLFIKKIDKMNSIIESIDLSDSNNSIFLSLIEDSPKSHTTNFSNEYDVICL